LGGFVRQKIPIVIATTIIKVTTWLAVLLISDLNSTAIISPEYLLPRKTRTKLIMKPSRIKSNPGSLLIGDISRNIPRITSPNANIRIAKHINSTIMKYYWHPKDVVGDWCSPLYHSPVTSSSKPA